MTQEDMGGLLPGDVVESLLPQYKKAGGLREVTHSQPKLHKVVINKRLILYLNEIKENEILQNTEIFKENT